MTAFSRQKCHETRAAVKPSLPFLEWLASSSGPGWQLRGDLDLGDEELGAILGEELRRKLRVTSTSLWSGSGGSRTPYIGTTSRHSFGNVWAEKGSSWSRKRTWKTRSRRGSSPPQYWMAAPSPIAKKARSRLSLIHI